MVSKSSNVITARIFSFLNTILKDIAMYNMDKNKEKMLTYTTQHNCLKKKVNSCDHCDMIFSTKPNLKSHVFTLAGTDLLCMLNWGTQWRMVSYLKK